VFVLPGPGRLLLCSDGLWNYAEQPAELAAKIAEQPADVDPLPLARFLTDFARQAGGHDNITVVVADVPASSLAGAEAASTPTSAPTAPPASPTTAPTAPATGPTTSSTLPPSGPRTEPT
jgi:serine/threonine protein phosphatase PrpC